jgi:hypothetical protein
MDYKSISKEKSTRKKLCRFDLYCRPLQLTDDAGKELRL